MMELTELDKAYLQRDAAWFWIEAMLDCQRKGVPFDDDHIQARLDHLKNMDPADVPDLQFTPAEWDMQTLARLPFIEEAAREIRKLQTSSG